MGAFYTVPEANQALIITGGLRKRDPNKPSRVVTGSGALTIPILHKVRRFYIGTRNVSFNLVAQTKSNVEINVTASVNYKVDSSSHDAIARAAMQFLGSSKEEIEEVAVDAFSGATRGLIGGMEVEEIISDRIELAQQVIEEVSARMMKYGWDVTGFQINSISDDNGHIEALSQPELQRVRRMAEVAKSENDREIAKKQQETKRDISEYQRDTDLKTSDNVIQTAKKRAEAEQAFKIEMMEQDKILAQKEAELEKAKTSQREAEVHNEVVVPAQKAAEARRIQAEAEAAAIEKESEAYAKHGGIFLEKMAYEMVPDVAERMKDVYKDANVTIVGNNDDIQAIATSAIANFSTIKDAIAQGASGGVSRAK